MAAPSSPSNLILILPFTPSVLLWSTPLLSTIYSTVRRHPTLASLLVYFSTPGAESSAQGEHDQLYDDLRARPRATWSTFQRFLSVIYSTLAAAQWEGAGDGDGRIGVRVDVGFEGVEGRWGSRFEECDVALVLQGMSPFCDYCGAKERRDCTCGMLCRRGVNIYATKCDPRMADEQATNNSPIPLYRPQRLKLSCPVPSFHH